MINPSPDPDDLSPPGWRRVSELMWQWPRAWRGVGHLGPRGPAEGPPVLVIPGFIANDRTVMELRRALADAGWRVHPWQLGWNLGARDDTVASMRNKVHQYRGIPLIVTYHPAYLLRSLAEKARAWEDLCFAVDTMQGLQNAKPDTI